MVFPHTKRVCSLWQWGRSCHLTAEHNRWWRGELCSAFWWVSGISSFCYLHGMGDKAAQWKGSISIYHFVKRNTHEIVTHLFCWKRTWRTRGNLFWWSQRGTVTSCSRKPPSTERRLQGNIWAGAGTMESSETAGGWGGREQGWSRISLLSFLSPSIPSLCDQ